MERRKAMNFLKVVGLYFGLVFGAGFLFGPVRVLLIQPQIGSRAAELVEAPLMLTAILIAGRWIGRSWCRSLSDLASLCVGLTVAGLVLTADVVVGVGLRGMSVVEVFTDRDVVTGPVYYGLIAVTAATPWWFAQPILKQQKS
jgi:hypothetical protein